MLRAWPWALIFTFLGVLAQAAPAVDQDLSAALRRLETGDWNTRMRTVHELEYMQAEGVPGLAAAAEDGDWQVRMAAVQALGAAGRGAVPILKSILKTEPCPVVRLIALHNLGSQADDGEEKLAIDWMLSAEASQVNNCRDQPEAGPAGWARRPRKSPPETTPSAPPAPPTKNERYAELDALLTEHSGSKDANESAALSGRRTAAPESLPKPVVTTPAEKRPEEAPAEFEAVGGKAPHDAIPDLILALKSGSVGARSRAADELGYSGAAAGSAAPALMAALKDKSPRVRASASLALGNIGAAADGVVPLLVKALKDKNLDVRYAATLALSRIGTPAARRAFKKYIGEDARRAIENQPP